MPLILGKKTEQPTPQQPLFERIQDWIFKLDVGLGVQWFRLGLFCLLVLMIILLYTGTQFVGLRDPEAMDMGQLGRNLWRGRGYVTEDIRPMALGYLNSIGKPLLDAKLGTQPELWTPPFYPLLLSTVFRVVQPDFQMKVGMQTVRADRLLMVVSWLFYLVGMVLMYMLAREMFDHRVAVLSAFLYLFCDSLLDMGMSGLPMGLLSVLFLTAAHGVLKAEKWQEAGRSAWWVNGALAASALAVGLGTLTQYAFASVLVPLLVYIAVSFPKQWHMKVGLCLGVFLLVLTPWVVRNVGVAQTPFGLAPFEVLEGVGKGTATEIKPGQLQRAFEVDLPRFKVWPVIRKALLNGRELYENVLKEVGSNYLIAFFLAALLHRFRRVEVFRLRRLVFWSMLISMVWLAVAGLLQRNFLNVFMPLVIIYAAAFFYVLFERLQFRTRLLRTGMVGLFVALNAVPFIFTILPPGVVYFGPDPATIVEHVAGTFREDEALMSDAPWAVAWYADRTAIWLPFDAEGHPGEKDFFAINDNVHPIAGIYLTQAILEHNPAEMMSAHDRFWMGMFFYDPPANLPLKVKDGWLTVRGIQVLISTRHR
jgi:hypothetical protein